MLNIFLAIGIIYAVAVVVFVLGACRLAAQADRDTEHMLDLMADEREDG